MSRQKQDGEHYTRFNRILKSRAVQLLLDRMDDGTYREFLADWRWIFSFSANYKCSILIYTLMGIFSTSMGLVSSVVSKYLIDIITGYQINRLWVLVAAMIGSTVFSLVFSSLVSRYSARLSISVGNDIQAEIFDKIMDADWLKLNGYASGDLLNRFNSDVNTIATNAVSWIPNVIISLYSFFASFAVILHYNTTMAWIAFLSAPVLLVSSRFLMRKNREYRRHVLELNSEMMSFESEAFYNIDTIKSFGIMGFYGEKLRSWQKKYKDCNLDYNLFSIKMNIWMSLLGAAVSFIAFAYCLFLLWTKSISYGTMTLFLQQRAKLSSDFNSLIGIFPSMLNSAVSAQRVRELLELPKEEHALETTHQLEELADDGFTVCMRGVYFSYTESSSVLTDSDFLACPNEIVALVGPSGEGKTTMLRMILGLIHPDGGTAVLIDSTGNEIPMNADLRRFFSYVPQGNTIVSGTIAENLRMVREDATDEQIIDALKIACAWDFVRNLPDGIHSPLGERGRRVSEGQAQRIAIARAVLRDCPILLLDEATSALDVETERRVLKNIIQQRPNKTCIVTTHRPSVLGMCRRVYRVKNTRVTELDEAESARLVQDW